MRAFLSWLFRDHEWMLRKSRTRAWAELWEKHGTKKHVEDRDAG